MKCTFGRPSNEPNTESITTEWQTREHDNNQHAKTTTYGLSFITIYPVSSSIHHDHGFTLYIPLKVNRKSVWIEWILFPQFSAYATRVWLHTGKFTAYIHPGIIPSLDGLKPSASVDGVVLLSVFWEKPAAPFKCRIWKQETGLTKWLTLECSLFLTLMLSPFLYPCASSILAYDTMTRFPRASAPPRHIDWWERPRLFDRLQKGTENHWILGRHLSLRLISVVFPPVVLSSCHFRAYMPSSPAVCLHAIATLKNLQNFGSLFSLVSSFAWHHIFFCNPQFTLLQQLVLALACLLHWLCRKSLRGGLLLLESLINRIWFDGICV